MAITDSQKVDLLWKKVGFSKAKTDTNAQKKAPNEATVSDFVIKPNQIWTNSNNIPTVIPTANSSVVDVYLDVINRIEEEYDLVICLQQDNPYRSHTFDECINYMIKNNYDD